MGSMRLRPRTVIAAALALTLGVATALLLAGGSTAQQTKFQSLFRKTLLEDEKTISGVKKVLREGGFVAPAMQFGDLTGDERSDAVVLVESGGAGGAIALYVFSTHGRAADSALRAVYRSQSLYRASAEISAGTLIVSTPRYRRGDDLCCPAKELQRVYAWSSSAKTLKLRSSQERTGPTGEPATTTTPPPPTR
jgi:hypothetical protein